MTLEDKIRQIIIYIENYRGRINTLTEELSRMEQKLDELRHELQVDGCVEISYIKCPVYKENVDVARVELEYESEKGK